MFTAIFQHYDGLLLALEKDIFLKFFVYERKKSLRPFSYLPVLFIFVFIIFLVIRMAKRQVSTESDM